jgi:hypothetical protein
MVFVVCGSWVGNEGDHYVENSSCRRDCVLRWHSLYNSSSLLSNFALIAAQDQ